MRNGASLGADELRKESQEEQRDLGVEDVHQESLGEDLAAGKSNVIFRDKDKPAREDRTSTQVNQVGRAEKFREGEGGR